MFMFSSQAQYRQIATGDKAIKLYTDIASS